MRLILSPVSTLALGALSLVQDATTPQLTYRTGIDLVQVDVSVLDKDRRPVLGLKPGDFVLKEDGKLKAIAAFSPVTLPVPPSEPAAPWIDVDPDDPFGAHRGECRCGLCSLEVMANVADAVREVAHRRKMLLFIGSDVSVSTTTIECFAEVREAREKLLRAAGAANLTIHTFDSNLLQSGGSSSAQRGGIPEVTDASGRSPALIRQGNLDFFPGETGGRAIKNTNAPWEPIPAIFDETHSYYVLGFAPSAPNDGSYHNIAVEVNLPGVHVYPRKGYYTSPSRPDLPTPATSNAPPALTAALRKLWPETQLPMSVTAAAFKASSSGGAAVAVVARAQEPLQPGTDRGSKVNVMAGAFGREGETLATQVQTITVRPPAAGQKVFQYEVSSRLHLKTGRHEIRVAAEDPERHLVGSVYTYVNVPDFAKESISMSGVVLGTRASEPDGPFHDLIPVIPTTRREFAASDRVTAFVRAYQAEKDDALPVTIVTRIVDSLNRKVFEAKSPLPADPPARSADYRFELPLSSLAAGQYLLTDCEGW